MVDVIGDQNTVQIGLRPLILIEYSHHSSPDDLITDESPLVAFRSDRGHHRSMRNLHGDSRWSSEAAGLLVGDRVTAVNGKSVADWAEFVTVIKGAMGFPPI